MHPTAPGDDTLHRQPVRVLALDGGGVRGLSSLLILRELMERLGVKKSLARPADLRPSECFDLIIGTGTGGISALFLGRLRMTVDEAIEEYTRMAEKAFKPSSKRFTRWLRGQEALMDGAVLDCVIGDVVQKFLRSRDVLFEDPSGASCSTAVLAATNANVDAPPYIFRSYATNQPASQFTIREVARATISAAGLFPAASLGNPPVHFIDAGIAGYNNPAKVGLDEAAKFSRHREVDCLVSLGTGLQKIVSVGEGWAKVARTCTKIIQSCEQVNNLVFGERKRDGLPYYRFNVDRGLDAVDVKEWNAAGLRGTLAGITSSYLLWAEVSGRLDSCARTLNDETLPSAQSLGHFQKEVAQLELSTMNHIHTTVDTHHRLGAETHSQLQKIGAGIVHLENGMRRLTAVHKSAPLDQDGIPIHTRKDFRVLREIPGCRHHDRKATITFQHAESVADSCVVLVKTYEGFSPSLKERAFSDDLTSRKTLWRPWALQLIGASRPSDALPFQVYHLPSTDCEPFGAWYARTSHSNPAETIRGLYDMRNSIRDMLVFQRERSIFFRSISLFGPNIVKIQSHGRGHEWSLVYVGELSERQCSRPVASVDEPYTNMNRVEPHENIPAEIAAFCGGLMTWIKDDRRLEEAVQLEPQAMNLSTLASSLFEVGWLGVRELWLHSEHGIGLGDIGYITEGRQFKVVAKLDTQLIPSQGDALRWKTQTVLDCNPISPSDMATVECSGKIYRRYEFHQARSGTEEYVDVDSEHFYENLDTRHAWKLLQARASEIMTRHDLSIAPHDLCLVCGVRTFLDVRLRIKTSTKSGNDYAIPDASDWEEDPTENMPGYFGITSTSETHSSSQNQIAKFPTWYLFEEGNGIGESPPPHGIRVLPSFEAIPEWLDSADWSATRYGDVKEKDDFVLECQKNGHDIKFFQLPAGVALPHITEVSE